MKVPSAVFFSCFFCFLFSLFLSFSLWGFWEIKEKSFYISPFFLLFFSLLLFLYDIHSVPGLEKGGGGRVLS